MNLGDKLPYFELSGIDGKTYSLVDVSDKSCVLILFVSNTCPFVKAYTSRINDLIEKFYEDNMGTFLVNPNQGEAESMELMKQFFKENKFQNAAYLKDVEKSLANALGATQTPEAFLFNSKRELVYKGAIDDSWDQPNLVTRVYLEDAIEFTLDGLEVDFPETEASGCSIR